MEDLSEVVLGLQLKGYESRTIPHVMTNLTCANDQQNYHCLAAKINATSLMLSARADEEKNL